MSEQLKTCLREISARLLGFEWLLIGSTNMLLQGMSLHPRDVDILMKREDLVKAHQLFPEAEPITHLKPGVDEFTLVLNACDVQVLGEEKNQPYRKIMAFENVMNMTVDDFFVHATPLDRELQAYRLLGRDEKAQMIEKFINQ